MKKKKNAGFRRAVAAILLLALLAGPVPKGSAAVQTDYIVKYKADAAALMADADMPFDVVDEAEMRRLDSQGLLEWYEPDGEAVLLDDELTGPAYFDERQWNLDMIGAGTAFERGFLGQGVRVGVMDSGVNPHPDLRDKLLAGHNYISDASNPNDTSDSYGHGTRVAGLVAASNEDGFVGVAPGAEIVPLKVTDGKSVKISAVCKAIYGGVDDYGCTVLNLSLGVQTEYESLREAVEYAESRGVVIVAAVGNGGTSTVYYPAGYDSVISVGAVDSAKNIYSRSNHNDSVWITAPGVEVRTTADTGGYMNSTGTSFSVPQAAGAAAVLLSAAPALTPEAIRELLAATAEDHGGEGYDVYYGHGILNLDAAVRALDGGADSGLRFLPEAGQASALKNETDEERSCTYLAASCDENGACSNVDCIRLTVPAGGSVDLPASAGVFGQFICDTDTLAPLAAERRIRSASPPGPDAPTDPEAGFYDVGTAASVEIVPCGQDAPASAEFRNVDGAYGGEAFYPGTDRLRVTLPGAQLGESYLLTVSDPRTGTVYYADQRTAMRTAAFDVAFRLPQHRTELCLSVGSTAAEFGRIDIPLFYTPSADGTACTGGESCPLTAFADLDAGAWYHHGVHWALEADVMKGMGSRTFAPGQPATRAMIVTMLYRMEGEPEAAAAAFHDVPAGRWYTDAVNWACENGIVNGYSAGTFGADDLLTREQLVTILERYARFRGMETGQTADLGSFADAGTISGWAAGAFRWAVDAGIINGVTETTLSPGTAATRAQSATVLMRCFFAMKRERNGLF